MKYEIKEKILPVAGCDIAYTDTGSESGRVVFCVHGLLSNGRDYDFLALELAQKGFRVIAMDLPGRGKSGRFSESGQYIVPSYISYCLALINHVAQGQGFDWLGVSLGGMIGMALHGFDGIKMERLILVDIGAEIPATAMDAVALLAKAPVRYETKQTAIDFFKTRCSAWGITEPHIWDHLISHNIIEGSDGAFYMHYDPLIGAALPEKNETVVFWELWEKIQQPVFLLRGGLSYILPEDIAIQMQARYTGQKMGMKTFEVCGHVPNLMQVDHIDAIAAWLMDH